MLKIDLQFRISSDALTLNIYDDSIGWGEGGDPIRTDIDSVEIILYDYNDTILATITDNPLDSFIELSVVDDLGYTTDGLPNGIYKYKVTYSSTTPSWTQVKADGRFYSTTLLEQHINDDLLDVLVGIQAYNYRLDYPKLEEIRRRDNILFALNTAEYLADEENVLGLISYLERVE